jgi:hypothetical protein
VKTLLFHGGDTGSTSLRDAKTFNQLPAIAIFAVRPKTSVKLNRSLAGPRQKHVYKLIRPERKCTIVTFRVSVAQQFLNDLRVSSLAIKIVPKLTNRAPANTLLKLILSTARW